MPQIAREKHIASDEKARLSETIKSQARSHSFLDEQVVSCYTEGKELSQGSECDEENTLCVSRHGINTGRKPLIYQAFSDLKL